MAFKKIIFQIDKSICNCGTNYLNWKILEIGGRAIFVVWCHACQAKLSVEVDKTPGLIEIVPDLIDESSVAVKKGKNEENRRISQASINNLTSDDKIFLKTCHICADDA